MRLLKYLITGLLLISCGVATAQFFVIPDSLRANKGVWIGGDKITMVRLGTVSIDPPNVLAATTGDIAVTITGVDAASAWNVNVTPTSALTSGLGVAGAWVSADNQITVRFANPTILAINQGAATFSYLCVK